MWCLTVHNKMDFETKLKIKHTSFIVSKLSPYLSERPWILLPRIGITIPLHSSWRGSEEKPFILCISPPCALSNVFRTFSIKVRIEMWSRINHFVTPTCSSLKIINTILNYVVVCTLHTNWEGCGNTGLRIVQSKKSCL